MKPEIIEVFQAPKHLRRRGLLAKCKCPYCGKEFTAIKAKVERGDTISCGCLKAAEYRNYPLGIDIHKRWLSMKQRVFHEPTYVEKGITICHEWLDFKTFYDWAIIGFSPELEIDRKDNKLGYSPENCHWVTRLENLRNRDKQTINEEIAFKIKTKLLNGATKKELATEFNCSWDIVSQIYVNKSWKDVCERAEQQWLLDHNTLFLPEKKIKTRPKRGKYKPERKYTAEYRRIEYQKYAKKPKIFENESVQVSENV
jgi:hypothetical protein